MIRNLILGWWIDRLQSRLRRRSSTFVSYPRTTDVTPPWWSARSSASEWPHWQHPAGHPYQVFGGPYCPEEVRWTKTVWTSARSLPEYELVTDHFSDRKYHIWRM